MATCLGRGFWICVDICMYAPLGLCVCNATVNITAFVLCWSLEGVRTVLKKSKKSKFLIIASGSFIIIVINFMFFKKGAYAVFRRCY